MSSPWSDSYCTMNILGDKKNLRAHKSGQEEAILYLLPVEQNSIKTMTTALVFFVHFDPKEIEEATSDDPRQKFLKHILILNYIEMISKSVEINSSIHHFINSSQYSMFLLVKQIMVAESSTSNTFQVIGGLHYHYSPSLSGTFVPLHCVDSDHQNKGLGSHLLRKLQSLVNTITGDQRLLILISKSYVFKNLTTDENQFKRLVRYYRNLQFHPTSSQNYALPYLLPTKVICDLQNPDSKKNILLELNHELKIREGKTDTRTISEENKNGSLIKCELQCDICGMLRNNANADKCFMLCKQIILGSRTTYKPFNKSSTSKRKTKTKIARKRPIGICGVSLCFTCQTEQGVNVLDTCAMHYEHTDNVDIELDTTVIESSVKYIKDVLENNTKKDMRDIYFSPTFQKTGSKYNNNYLDCKHCSSIILLQKAPLLQKHYRTIKYTKEIEPNDPKKGQYILFNQYCSYADNEAKNMHYSIQHLHDAPNFRVMKHICNGMNKLCSSLNENDSYSHPYLFNGNSGKPSSALQNRMFEIKNVDGHGDCGFLSMLYAILSADINTRTKIKEAIDEFCQKMYVYCSGYFKIKNQKIKNIPPFPKKLDLKQLRRAFFLSKFHNLQNMESYEFESVLTTDFQKTLEFESSMYKEDDLINKESAWKDNMNQAIDTLVDIHEEMNNNIFKNDSIDSNMSTDDLQKAVRKTVIKNNKEIFTSFELLMNDYMRCSYSKPKKKDGYRENIHLVYLEMPINLLLITNNIVGCILVSDKMDPSKNVQDSCSISDGGYYTKTKKHLLKECEYFIILRHVNDNHYDYFFDRHNKIAIFPSKYSNNSSNSSNKYTAFSILLDLCNNEVYYMLTGERRQVQTNNMNQNIIKENDVWKKVFGTRYGYFINEPRKYTECEESFKEYIKKLSSQSIIDGNYINNKLMRGIKWLQDVQAWHLSLTGSQKHYLTKQNKDDEGSRTFNSILDSSECVPIIIYRLEQQTNKEQETNNSTITVPETSQSMIKPQYTLKDNFSDSSTCFYATCFLKKYRDNKNGERAEGTLYYKLHDYNMHKINSIRLECHKPLEGFSPRGQNNNIINRFSTEDILYRFRIGQFRLPIDSDTESAKTMMLYLLYLQKIYRTGQFHNNVFKVLGIDSLTEKWEQTSDLTSLLQTLMRVCVDMERKLFLKKLWVMFQNHDTSMLDYLNVFGSYDEGKPYEHTFVYERWINKKYSKKYQYNILFNSSYEGIVNIIRKYCHDVGNTNEVLTKCSNAIITLWEIIKHETSKSFNVTFTYLQYARLFESWDREEIQQEKRINSINNIKKILLCSFFNGGSIFSKNSLTDKIQTLLLEKYDNNISNEIVKNNLNILEKGLLCHMGDIDLDISTVFKPETVNRTYTVPDLSENDSDEDDEIIDVNNIVRLLNDGNMFNNIVSKHMKILEKYERKDNDHHEPHLENDTAPIFSDSVMLPKLHPSEASNLIKWDDNVNVGDDICCMIPNRRGGGTSLTFKEIQSNLLESEINDNVKDAITQIFMIHQMSEDSNGKKVFLTQCAFQRNFEQNDFKNAYAEQLCPKYYYDDKEEMEQVNFLNEYDIFLFPWYCEVGKKKTKHWVLFYINFNTKIIQVLDSYQSLSINVDHDEKKTHFLVSVLWKLLRFLFVVLRVSKFKSDLSIKDFRYKHNDARTYPQQETYSVDCGVFVLMACYSIIKHKGSKELYKDSCVKKFRLFMFHLLCHYNDVHTIWEDPRQHNLKKIFVNSTTGTEDVDVDIITEEYHKAQDITFLDKIEKIDFPENLIIRSNDEEYGELNEADKKERIKDYTMPDKPHWGLKSHEQKYKDTMSSLKELKLKTYCKYMCWYEHKDDKRFLVTSTDKTKILGSKNKHNKRKFHDVPDEVFEAIIETANDSNKMSSELEAFKQKIKNKKFIWHKMPASIKHGVQSTFKSLFYDYAIFNKDYTHMKYLSKSRIIVVLMQFETDYIFTHRMTKDWLNLRGYYQEMISAIEKPDTNISLGCGSAKQDALNNKRKRTEEKPCVQYVQEKKNKCFSRGLCSALYFIDWKRNKMTRNKTKRKRLKRNKQAHGFTHTKTSENLFEIIIQTILQLKKKHTQATLLHKCVSIMQDNNWTCEIFVKQNTKRNMNEEDIQASNQKIYDDEIANSLREKVNKYKHKVIMVQVGPSHFVSVTDGWIFDSNTNVASSLSLKNLIGSKDCIEDCEINSVYIFKFKCEQH